MFELQSQKGLAEWGITGWNLPAQSRYVSLIGSISIDATDVWEYFISVRNEKKEHQGKRGG